MTVRRTPMLLAVAALAALAVCVGPAQSAFPGENGKIAFVSDLWGPLDIYSINPDGTDQTRLTTNVLASGIRDGGPAWSPDGSKIAFARGPGFSDSTYANVFRMNADGSDQTNLTNELSSFNTDPAWSPAGNAIAFVSDRVNSTADIFRMNADGTGQVNLTNTVDDRESDPSWSPDGSRIAYSGFGSVMVMNADGSDPTSLTNPTGSNSWFDGDPSWSPTGDKIAFRSDRDSVLGEIYVMDSDGSGVMRLTTHAGGNSGPRWSPDGTKIVFERYFTDGSYPAIYVLDLANPASTPQPLGTQGLGSQVIATHPDWQPLTGGENTTPGTNVSVTPVDLATGDSPVTITFDQVTAAGVTTLLTSSSGPPPPHDFEVAGVYYNLSTTAQFSGQVEVCFAIVQPNAPPIGHWVGIPRLFTTPTTYYKDVAGPSGVIVSAGQGNYACASVTSFSPFALLVPTASEDGDPPVIACGAADGAWHDANASIDCTASDAGSGLANADDAAFSLMTSVPDGTEDADAATESRQVCDLAGNCAPAGPIGGNKVDRRDPTLVLPGAPTVDATSPTGAIVNYSASATDGAHPTPSVSCTPASGTAFAIGTTTVACTATDHVGNTSTGSFAVTVRGAKAQLARLIDSVVNASGLPPALKTQLVAKLQALTASFDPANAKQKQAVCVALNVFKGVVQAFSGRGIPPAQASGWIADANRIRAVLAC